MNNQMIDIGVLIDEVLKDYALPWYGLHGVSHWGRVLENGLSLAQITGADTDVVTLFAIFHDSRRLNENHDPGHGRRGADLAASLRGTLVNMSDRKFEAFVRSLRHHTDGRTAGDPTLQTCWDADRLDLGRVGVKPHPARLCTEPEDSGMIKWASERAWEEVVPCRPSVQSGPA